jgi:hypothetical protein
MMVTKAGVAKIRINPNVGAPMAGYITREKPSQGIHDDLYAKALVLDDGKKEVVIITTDLIAVDADFVAKIRKVIERKTGISRNNILIGASHTHAGPVTVELWPSSKVDRSYLKILREKLIRVTIQAHAKRRCAKIGFGRGRVNIGTSREGIRGPVDPEVGVIRVDDLKGNVMAILINYACHPTVLDHKNLLFSADYPGCAIQVIEKKEKTIGLFTCGAAAGVSTRYLDRESSFKKAKRLGSLLAEEVLNVCKRIKVGAAKLDVTRDKIKLRSRSLSHLLEETKRTLKKTRDKLIEEAERGIPQSEIRKLQINIEGAIAIADLVETYKQREIEIEIQAIKIGNTILVGVPAELSVVIGKHIKRKAKPKNALIIGYANGYVGYIPSSELYRKGGYEVMVTPFYSDAEEKIKNVILRAIRRLK